MSQRRTTGLSGLDSQLGGGTLAGTALLLIGPPMNAFELVGYHFAAGGTKAGKVVFLSTDRSPDEVLDGVRRVGGDAKNVQAIRLAPTGDWTIPPLEAGTRYVIDDLASIVGVLGPDAVLERLAGLRTSARPDGIDMLVTLTEGILAPADEVRMKQWADGVLELGFDRQGFGLYPYLKVTKMRGVPDSSRLVLFKETDAGLFIESTRRVF